MKAIVAALFEEHPDGPDTAPREYDVHDAAAARAAVRRGLTRKRV